MATHNKIDTTVVLLMEEGLAHYYYGYYNVGTTKAEKENLRTVVLAHPATPATSLLPEHL